MDTPIVVMESMNLGVNALPITHVPYYSGMTCGGQHLYFMYFFYIPTSGAHVQ